LRVVPGDDVGVTADATLLQQVLMNLCLNARDAMPEGGILTVRTERDRERREVLMQVSDTGGGIPPEFRERIFEPFFTTKEVGKGTGLGLATVYTIVEQHDGRIDVDSEVGAGTTFTVRLPAAETVVDGCGNGEQQPSDRGDEVILVAEDDYFVRDWVVRVLKRAGYKVHVAADGAEAIEVFQAQCAEIDLVLLDYILPGVTGAVVHERLAQLHADIPFVICTAYDARSPQTEYVRANQIEMLQKPYDKHTLLATIRRVLDHRHGRIGAAIAGGRAI
jgi:CheY-like chemotaxis protein